jgi:inorganic pyrophosphatase
MSKNLYHLPIHKFSPCIINCIIEIPKDTNVKYEYDNDYGVFKYDRSLISAMVYPASYGFIPSTKSDDGDALDVLIYNSRPIDTGTLVEAKVVGVLDMTDDGDKDYKILATPTSHVREYHDLSDIDPQFLKICQNFFNHYKDLNNKNVEVFDWHESEFAYKIIKDSLIKH